MNQAFELYENSCNGPKCYVGLGNTGPSIYRNYLPSPNIISAATSINEDKKENNVKSTTRPDIVEFKQKPAKKKTSQNTKKERINKLSNPNKNELAEFDNINLNSSNDMNQKNFLGKKREHEKSQKVGKKKNQLFGTQIECNKTEGINLKEEQENISKEHTSPNSLKFEGKKINKDNITKEVHEHIYGHYSNDEKKKKISDIKKMTSNILNNFQGLKESKHSNPKELGLDIEEVKIKKFEDYQEIDNCLNFDLNKYEELIEKQLENDSSFEGNNEKFDDISERVISCSFNFQKNEGFQIFKLNEESFNNIEMRENFLYDFDQGVYGNIPSEEDRNMFRNNKASIQSSENGLNLLFSDLRDYEKNLFV